LDMAIAQPDGGTVSRRVMLIHSQRIHRIIQVQGGSLLKSMLLGLWAGTRRVWDIFYGRPGPKASDER
jgi:hypothetical protein